MLSERYGIFLRVINVKGMEHSGKERVVPNRRELFWMVAKGDTLKSEFGSKILQSKKYKDKLT